MLDILNKLITEWIDFQPTKKEILRFLNDVAPDTYNEGEYGNWEFKDVTKDGNEYTIDFENEHYEAEGERNSDSITFTTDLAPLNADGGVNLDWLDILNKTLQDEENPSGMYGNEDDEEQEDEE
ncbi:MAG: hypothetical protein IPJ81_01415 [Chitinophagaceae bacterium]|nr:hypothetical protein [Chitinophagaceae bacterium]